MFSRTLLTSVLAVGLFAPAAAAQAQDSLVTWLRANAHTMSATTDGKLSGPGAELLTRAGREAHFFLVGEEHGIAEIPMITAALYRELVPAGYRHFAIEIGDALAGETNRLLTSDPTGQSLLSFQKAHWPGLPFFSRREEASLLAAVVAASGRRRDVLWGLDYDIVADRYALRRLRAIAPNARARRVADSVIALADSGLSQAMTQKNPGMLMMFGGPEGVYADLRKAYAPRAGSEADRIIALMQSTRAINGLFVARRGLESNDERARWNKQRFMSYLRGATGPSGVPPKVMMKFGASHMMRGRTLTNVYDLGTLASEIADVNGSRSFGVFVVGGAGTQHAVTDPTVMRSVAAPVDFDRAAWARAFFEAADSTAWTVFDLRPLRSRIPRLGPIDDTLARVLYGFDAFIVLSGSTSQTDLSLK